MHKILAKIWKLFKSNYKWHILWFFHDKFMIGTSGVVFNNKGEVLLLKHRFWKKDSWGLPSGYAQKRERLEDTIKREVNEETKLNIKVVKLINLKSGFKLRIECTFIAFCENSENIKINGDEVLEAKFFNVQNLPDGTLQSHVDLINIAVQQKN